MTFDRAAQFAPIDKLKAAGLLARVADDSATTAMDAKSDLALSLSQQITALSAKMRDKGATSTDYRNIADLTDQLDAANAPFADLTAAQGKTHVAWDVARQAIRDWVDSLDQDPGVVEKT